jgi:hypothetical protein
MDQSVKQATYDKVQLFEFKTTNLNNAPLHPPKTTLLDDLE